MAAAAILEKFRMAISPQRLTIYLYSAHRAVIFAIAQLSCMYLRLFYTIKIYLLTNLVTYFRFMCSVSQKKSPPGGPDIFHFFSQTVENFYSIFYTPIIRSYPR